MSRADSFPVPICMFGEHISGALDGSSMKGGAELQLALLAKTLAGAGFAVTIVDPKLDHAIAPMENLQLTPVPHWHEGTRGLRFITHRIPNLWRTLRSTRARLFYVRGFSHHFLLTWLVVRSLRSRFVLAMASDFDLLGFRERYRILYKRNSSAWGWISTIIPNELAHALLLRIAGTLFVQHGKQMTIARRYSKHVFQVNNIVEMNPLRSAPTVRERKNIILVGTISAYKGLRPLVPIIQSLPDVTFEFVGSVQDKEGREVYDALSSSPNVIFAGQLDRERTLCRIAHAKALLNTSLREGFPNTFLEAWSLGTPVISLHVDPGDVIKTHGLGYACSGDLSMLRSLLRREAYDIDRKRIDDYLQKHHSGAQAEEVFRTLLKAS